MTDPKKRLRKQIFMSMIILLSILAIAGAVTGVKIFAQDTVDKAGEGTRLEANLEKSISPEQASVSRFAFMAAAVAFGLGAIGAGIAIGNVGAAAMGAIAEKPEVAGQALIFVALAEGLVVFGFITALMILGKA